jgi:hypothetical protein
VFVERRSERDVWARPRLVGGATSVNGDIRALVMRGDITATADADFYVPLSVRWHVPRTSAGLFLSVAGDAGGHVEFLVDARFGALVEFTMIDAPPVSDRAIPWSGENHVEGGVGLELGFWEWRATPDYVEPSSDYAGTYLNLSMSESARGMAVWFSDCDADRVATAGVARVGLCRHGNLAFVAAEVDRSSSGGEK